MSLNDSKNILVYNGEIYNHLKIRKKLIEEFQINFLSSSDTETLYYALQKYDFEKVLNQITGMFAFYYYDSKKNKLYIARDRAGEKPLYLHIGKNFFGISSDIITFKKNNHDSLKLNDKAINLYLDYNYIPNPMTIYKNCFKLPPGSLLELDLQNFKFENLENFNQIKKLKYFSFKKWWSVQDEIQKTDYSLNTSIKKINNSLFSIIDKQLMSDVPIGAFLSSGIDSSLIVSIMSKIRSNTETFTIGFENKSYDESHGARKISRYLNTTHNEKIMTSYDIKNIIPGLSDAYSEPFADSSQLPTLLLSKFAREKVKVVLTGDGGDELFGGYNRYLLANKYWTYYKFLPNYLKKFFFKVLNNSPYLMLLIFSNYLKISDTNRDYLKLRINKIIDKIKFVKDEKSYYQSMTKEWYRKDILNHEINISNFNKFFDEENNFNFIQKMMLSDFESYLTDDILCKVDRATMNYGLESRAPYLDQALVKFAYSMPIKHKIRGSSGKIVLRELLNQYLPKNEITIKKKGFAIPLEDWMNNELYDYTNEMLSSNTFNKHKLFNINKINQIISEYNNGYNNHINKLWSLIQFNSWYINNEG